MNGNQASKESFGARAGPVLGCAAVIVYMIVGAIQVFATFKGVAVTFPRLPSIIGGFVSLFIALLPIVGTLAGIKGAVVGWGWKLWPALALFCGPYALYFFAIICGGLADLWLNFRHRRRSQAK